MAPSTVANRIFLNSAFSMPIFKLNPKVKHVFADSIDLPMQAHATNILNVFRFVLSIVFIVSYLYLGKNSIWQDEHSVLTFKLSIAYFIFSIFILLISPLKSDVYRLSLPLQIISDIVFIILFQVQ